MSSCKALQDSNFLPAVDLLLKLETMAGVNLMFKNGETFLITASKWGSDQVLDWLIAIGARANILDKAKRTALSHAAQTGHIAIATRLIATDSACVSWTKSMENRTPLSYEAENRHHKIVAKLLVSNPACGYGGTVPLLIAVDRSSLGLRCSGGRTALSYAAKNGYDKCVVMLFKADSSIVNDMYSRGRTGLSHAVEGRHVAVVKELLTAKHIDILKNWY
ncbi:ankyrin [Microthyrium microscopicum]|uniref:Ankyrin n=1 Tax=Microthyrium microscopicum TaxID=703497 RepID=A0A6A6UCE0_9PEZI|nr:ankyrin [Microthyrium microscopicum]